MKLKLGPGGHKWAIIFFLIVFGGALAHLSYRYYLENTLLVPHTAGVFHEGLVGNLKTLNPLLSQGNEIEEDIESLLFSGLTKYHPVQKKIIPDLADFQISPNQKAYTFILKENLLWHDGAPLTAEDVIFTYNFIQNPHFPNKFLQRSLGEVKISKTDERTIVFTLSKPFYFFPTITTLAILPKHIWEQTAVIDFATASLTLPVIGSGPYKIRNKPVTENSPQGNRILKIELELFKNYFGSKPKIKNLLFYIAPSFSVLEEYLSNLDGVKNIPSSLIDNFHKEGRWQVFSYTLPRYVGLFLNTNQPFLKENKTRLGLQLATDKEEIIKLLPAAQRIDTPFLELDRQQWLYQYSLKKAQGALFDAGWKEAKEILQTQTGTNLTQTSAMLIPPKKIPADKNIRKNASGEFLTLNLITATEPSEFGDIAKAIKRQWQKAGVNLEISLLPLNALSERIKVRDYDILLYGQSLGYNLDAFPFWHSSQTSNQGLNLSNYRSFRADALLEEIRTPQANVSEEILKKRRKTALMNLSKFFGEEVPAIFLYQPVYYLAVDQKIKNVNISDLAFPKDRFALIVDWYMEERRAWKKDKPGFLQWLIGEVQK